MPRSFSPSRRRERRRERTEADRADALAAAAATVRSGGRAGVLRTAARRVPTADEIDEYRHLTTNELTTLAATHPPLPREAPRLSTRLTAILRIVTAPRGGSG